MAGKILLVDDDPEVVDFLSMLLRLEGFDTAVARTADAVLPLLESGPVDLVLMDVALPQLSGIEICRRIKSNPSLRAVPIFMISAHPGLEIVAQALDAGAEEFVRKPFDNAELVAQIRRRLKAGP